MSFKLRGMCVCVFLLYNLPQVRRAPSGGTTMTASWAPRMLSLQLKKISPVLQVFQQNREIPTFWKKHNYFVCFELQFPTQSFATTVLDVDFRILIIVMNSSIHFTKYFWNEFRSDTNLD